MKYPIKRIITALLLAPLAALHAADRFDLDPQHGLAIGHDGQCLHCRSGEADLLRRRLQAPEPGGEFGPRHQLEPAGHLHHPKRAALLIVQVVQLPD